MSESKLLKLIQAAVSKAGARVLRNNVGLGWTGRMITTSSGERIVTGPRPIRFGLCTGSSDLIGWTPVRISAEMVGQQIAVFTAIEVKSALGRTTELQQNFLAAVKSAGGIAVLARSEDDAITAVRNWGISGWGKT